MFKKIFTLYILISLFTLAIYSESQPNELGKFLIITYHVIGDKDTAYTRTIQGMKDDLALLKKGNYHPLKISDLENRNLNIPRGKRPVFITLDDSSQSQFDMDEKEISLPIVLLELWKNSKRKILTFH